MEEQTCPPHKHYFSFCKEYLIPAAYSPSCGTHKYALWTVYRVLCGSPAYKNSCVLEGCYEEKMW
jgi:hypothetical protein